MDIAGLGSMMHTMPYEQFTGRVNFFTSENFNNNNNNPLVNIRNHFYHVAFHRLALIHANIFTSLGRTMIEIVLLTLSILSFLVLTYMHLSFVRSPVNCLDNINGHWPRDGILRVEVVRNLNGKEYNLGNSYEKEKRIHQFDGSNNSFFFNDNAVEDMIHNYFDTIVDKNSLVNSTNDSLSTQDDEEEESNSNLYSLFTQEYLFANWPIDDYIVEYSLEYGYLRLNPNTRKKLNISVKMVTLESDNNTCFGNAFSRFLLDYFLGYDDVLLASLKNLAEKEEYKGYVRNVVTENDFIFVSSWMNDRSIFTAAFMMLLFTTCISILLRYCHHQMFLFIVEFLNMIDHRVSAYFPGVPVFTVILGLVGMEAIMSEFFNDTTLAFYIILIVWLADHYDSFWCVSKISRRHWLRFFFLYHFAFYAYCYKFNGHYANLALLTSGLFTLHSMVYFFHHYELPVLLRSAEQYQQQIIDQYNEYIESNRILDSEDEGTDPQENVQINAPSASPSLTQPSSSSEDNGSARDLESETTSQENVQINAPSNSPSLTQPSSSPEDNGLARDLESETTSQENVQINAPSASPSLTQPSSSTTGSSEDLAKQNQPQSPLNISEQTSTVKGTSAITKRVKLREEHGRIHQLCEVLRDHNAQEDL